MILDKGKFYKSGNRKYIVGHQFICMGVWQHRILYINKKGYVTTGEDCLYF